MIWTSPAFRTAQMRQGTSIVLFAAFAFLAAPFSAAQSQPEQDIARDVIHSDLPLFSAATAEVWPRAFSNDSSFGCASRASFGDWALRETDEEPGDAAQWYRIGNYGVFHCFAVVATADERRALDGADSKPAYFVLLGTIRTTRGETELWALQIGVRPGSEYLLLSRPPGQDPIRAFNVLQSQCPRPNIRDAGALGILLTRYCVANSRAELIALARRMARRPPRATLAFVDDEDAGAAD
jgi:hypothetical protein